MYGEIKLMKDAGKLGEKEKKTKTVRELNAGCSPSRNEGPFVKLKENPQI
jgi:hypothetical protein